MNGYAVVAHSKNKIIFGAMTFCVSLDLIFLYAFVYEKGICHSRWAAESEGSLKRKLILTPGKKAVVMARQIDSIPSVGLRLGDFHML